MKWVRKQYLSALVTQILSVMQSSKVFFLHLSHFYLIPYAIFFCYFSIRKVDSNIRQLLHFCLLVTRNQKYYQFNNLSKAIRKVVSGVILLLTNGSYAFLHCIHSGLDSSHGYYTSKDYLPLVSVASKAGQLARHSTLLLFPV